MLISAGSRRLVSIEHMFHAFGRSIYELTDAQRSAGVLRVTYRLPSRRLGAQLAAPLSEPCDQFALRPIGHVVDASRVSCRSWVIAAPPQPFAERCVAMACR